MIGRFILPLLALGLIGGGCAAVYWPSALIVVGSLLWIDLTLATSRIGRKGRDR